MTASGASGSGGATRPLRALILPMADKGRSERSGTVPGAISGLLTAEPRVRRIVAREGRSACFGSDEKDTERRWGRGMLAIAPAVHGSAEFDKAGGEPGGGWSAAGIQ